MQAHISRFSGQDFNMRASYNLHEALAKLPADDAMSMTSSNVLVVRKNSGYALNDFDDSYSTSEYQDGFLQRQSSHVITPTLVIMEQMSPKERQDEETQPFSPESGL